MAALQAAAQSNMNTKGSGWSKGAEMVVSEKFSTRLRILVVDDDTVFLRILERMLSRLLHHVTICSQATVALDLLRRRKGCFDMVLSDVHMPDMDGYKLLELVGLEMDLPVIMMSGDGRTSAVMKGIKHGACDYLIKPIREEELKNIWQHVVRKKWNEIKEAESSGSFESHCRNKQGNEEAENGSSMNESIEGAMKPQKRKNTLKDDDEDETENEDPGTSKKPRVVWSVELHQQFVSAVNQLGIDKAVPKRILELMNVPDLTRENVASHLQKFRLYLKRLSGVGPPSGASTICNMEPSIKLGPAARCDIQLLAASRQMHPQTLAALLGRPPGSTLNVHDPSTLLQPSLQGVNCIPVEHAMAFGLQMVEYPFNPSKQFQTSLMPTEDLPSGFGAWPQNNFSTVGGSHVGALSPQTKNLMADVSRLRPLESDNSPLPEPSHSINVQPSRLAVPSLSSNDCSSVKSPTSVNQNSCFSGGAIFNYSFLQSNNPSLNVGQIPDAYLKMAGVLSGYDAPPGPLSPSVSSCSVSAESSPSFKAQNQNMIFGSPSQQGAPGPAIGSLQGSYIAKSTEMFDQIPNESLGSTVQATSIPSRFALDDFVSSANGFVGSSGNKIKREPDTDFNDSVKVSSQALLQFPSNDLLGIFTK